MNHDPIYNDTTSIQIVPDVGADINVGHDLVDLMEKAKAFAESGISDNTRRAYRSDWNHYSAWCESVKLEALPAKSTTIVLYITHLAEEGAKVSTIRRRMAAISKAHNIAEVDSPVDNGKVKAVFKGIRREKGTAQDKKKAVFTSDIQVMLSQLPAKLIGVRNRALLLVGFAGGFRRSELTGLNIEDVEFCREGVILSIRSSKTDQEGEGIRIGIHHGNHEKTCPVAALQRWIDEAELEGGPLFRPIDRHSNVAKKRLNSNSVAAIVKRCALTAGLDPAKYAGHSLRSGLVTTAALNDAPVSSIMRQTRHTSFDTVRGYIREGTLFRQNVSAMLGL